MAPGDLPTPMSSPCSQAVGLPSRADELPSSSPCPVHSKGISKQRGRPTITPRSFGRFFAPKPAFRTGRTSEPLRHALGNVSASGVNARATRQFTPKRNALHPVFDEDENPDWGSNNLSKRHIALASPDTSLDSDTPRRPSKRARLHDPELELSDASSEDHDEPPAFKLRLRPKPTPVKRSHFRHVLGNVSRRELGDSTDAYRRIVGDYHQDWRAQVAGFYSGAEDVYVNQSSAGDGHYVLPFCAAACHTNSLVAVGDEDGYIKLLESRSGDVHGFSKPFHSFRAHTNALIDLEFTADDSLLATGSGDQTGRIIDMRTQECISQLRGHTSSVKQIRFQPGSGDSVLATSSREGTVLIWDLRCKDSRGFVNTASVHLEGDPSDRVEDLPRVSNMKSAACVRWIRQAHSTTVAPSEPPATPSTGDRSSRRRAKLQPRREVSVTTISFLKRSAPHLLLTGSEADATVRVWDLRSRQHSSHRQSLPTAVTGRPLAHEHHRDFGLTSMVLNQDGSRLYTLCKDHTVYAYSTSHLILGCAPEYNHRSNPGFGEEPKRGLGPLYGFRHPRLKASTFYVKAALRPAFRDHQELLAVGGTDKCAVLFPTDENFLKQEPQQRQSSASSPSLVPEPRDGKLSPPASGRGTSHRRQSDDLPIYTAGAALERGHESEVTGLTWTSEGELVTLGDDTRCRVWREDLNKARSLRASGEGGGERWLKGWAETSPTDSEDDE